MGRVLVILWCLPGAGSRAHRLQGLRSGTAIPAGEAPIQETGEAGCEPEAGRTVPTNLREQTQRWLARSSSSSKHRATC